MLADFGSIAFSDATASAGLSGTLASDQNNAYGTEDASADPLATPGAL